MSLEFIYLFMLFFVFNFALRFWFFVYFLNTFVSIRLYAIVACYLSCSSLLLFFFSSHHSEKVIIKFTSQPENTQFLIYFHFTFLWTAYDLSLLTSIMALNANQCLCKCWKIVRISSNCVHIPNFLFWLWSFFSFIYRSAILMFIFE